MHTGPKRLNPIILHYEGWGSKRRIHFFSVTPPRHTASDFNPLGTITFGRVTVLILFKLAEGFTGSLLVLQVGLCRRSRQFYDIYIYFFLCATDSDAVSTLSLIYTCSSLMHGYRPGATNISELPQGDEWCGWQLVSNLFLVWHSSLRLIKKYIKV